MAFKLDYFVRETGVSLKRNLTLTVAAVLTVAVSLSLFGVALWLRAAVDNATERWKGGVEFIVFMNPDATTDQIDAVGRGLAANPNVVADELTYCDQACAYEEFQRIFAGQPSFTENLGPSDVPSSWRVVPTEADADLIDSIGEAFRAQPGVFDVIYAKDTIEKIESLTGFLQLLALAAAVVLLASSTLLIVNTIRTAMFARRREIEVMKLVGATNWFIRVPFMLEGLVQGLLGAGLAYGSVRLAHNWFEGRIGLDQPLDFLSQLSVAAAEINQVGLIILGVGALVGALGSGVAVSRFLDV
jgi:cell division transport system permease protein